MSGKTKRVSKVRPPKMTATADPIIRPVRGKPYALKAVVGNITLTSTQTIAWYTLRSQSVSFMPDAEVNELIMDAGSALAGLVGYRVFFRVTSRPISLQEIGDRTWLDSVNRTKTGPLPGAREMIEQSLQQISRANLAEKYVFLGVRLATSRKYPADPLREVEALAGVIRDTVAPVVMTVDGLNAYPSTVSEMDLLLRRSFGLSLPLPSPESHAMSNWEQTDLPALASEMSVTAEPFAKTAVVSRRSQETGELESHHVAVLTMGRIGDVRIPERGSGWIHRTDMLPFPVEWVATIDILPDETVNDQTRHQIDKITDQFRHFEVEHGISAPRQLARQNSLALEVEDQLSSTAGLGGTATRADGWYRVAVWGQDESEVGSKVKALREIYKRQFEWWWSNGQYDLVREFVPGEPLANPAQKRRMTTPSVMASMPAATARIGDGYGATLGETVGVTTRPFLWNPWKNMEERNRSGLTIWTGGLGSGKTMAAGKLVFQTAMLGARWTVFDPSGQLGRLCEIPALRPYARHTDLMAGRVGELNPYRVLQDPRLDMFEDPGISELTARRLWQEAVAETKANRVVLCKDLLTQLLPKDLREDSRARSVIRAAVNAVEGVRESSPLMVIDVLERIANGSYQQVDGLEWTADHRIAADGVVMELRMFADTPQGRLVFGSAEDEPGWMDDEQNILLHVYSMNGLKIPQATDLDRGEESSSLRYSTVLFNLAAQLTSQAIYAGDRNERKGLFIDETHLMSAFESGEALVDRSSVDSRKFNCAVVLASQNVNHFKVEEIGPLCSTVVIGKTLGDRAVRDALQLAGIEVTPGAIAEVQRLSPGMDFDRAENPDAEDLSPREFLVSMKDLNQQEKIAAYGPEHPEAFRALRTTPNRVRQEVEA